METRGEGRGDEGRGADYIPLTQRRNGNEAVTSYELESQ